MLKGFRNSENWSQLGNNIVLIFLLFRRCIEEATQADLSNPEAFQAKANYALVVGNCHII